MGNIFRAVLILLVAVAQATRIAELKITGDVMAWCCYNDVPHGMYWYECVLPVNVNQLVAGRLPCSEDGGWVADVNYCLNPGNKAAFPKEPCVANAVYAGKTPTLLELDPETLLSKLPKWTSFLNKDQTFHYNDAVNRYELPQRQPQAISQ